MVASTRACLPRRDLLDRLRLERHRPARRGRGREGHPRQRRGPVVAHHQRHGRRAARRDLGVRSCWSGVVSVMANDPVMSTSRLASAVCPPPVARTAIGYWPAVMSSGGSAVTVIVELLPASTFAVEACCCPDGRASTCQPSGPWASRLKVIACGVLLLRKRSTECRVRGPVEHREVGGQLDASRRRTRHGDRELQLLVPPADDPCTATGRSLGRLGRHLDVELDLRRRRGVRVHGVDDEPPTPQEGRPPVGGLGDGQPHPLPPGRRDGQREGGGLARPHLNARVGRGHLRGRGRHRRDWRHEGRAPVRAAAAKSRIARMFPSRVGVDDALTPGERHERLRAVPPLSATPGERPDSTQPDRAL